MQISLLHSQDNSIFISNMIACVDYTCEMGTQKTIKDERQEFRRLR